MFAIEVEGICMCDAGTLWLVNAWHGIHRLDAWYLVPESCHRNDNIRLMVTVSGSNVDFMFIQGVNHATSYQYITPPLGDGCPLAQKPTIIKIYINRIFMGTCSCEMQNLRAFVFLYRTVHPEDPIAQAI
jgi:hypothetical protein